MKKSFITLSTTVHRIAESYNNQKQRKYVDFGTCVLYSIHYACRKTIPLQTYNKNYIHPSPYHIPYSLKWMQVRYAFPTY